MTIRPTRGGLFAAAFALVLLSGCNTMLPQKPQASSGINAQTASAQTVAEPQIGAGAGDSLGQTLFTPSQSANRPGGSVASSGGD